MAEIDNDSSEDRDSLDDTSSGSWRVSLAISLLVLAGAAGLAVLTFRTEPTAEKEGATRKTAMLVDVAEVSIGTYRPRLVTTGTVEPAREVELRPQVSGNVVSLSADFVPGGFVKRGDVVLTIDATDYRHELALKKGELSEALAALADEKSRQGAARADYRFLGEELPPEQRSLVLREAQLEAASERVEAARAAVTQAEVNISRTRLRAPFDAHVLRRDINVGSRVTPSDVVGRFVGIETYWVMLDLPVESLRWVEVPTSGSTEGSRVLIRNRKAWREGVHREARIVRLVGAVDGETRMAQAIAEVHDPLALKPSAGTESGVSSDIPALMVGSFVEGSIEGVEMTDVVRLPREYLRKGDTVWTMVDRTLRVAEVEVAVKDDQYVYVSAGLSAGDVVVTSNLSTVFDGAPLRLAGEEPADG